MGRKNKSPRVIQELIARIGTPTQFAAAIGVSEGSIDNWKRRGIPRKYWELIAEKCGVTEYDVYAIDKVCRAELKEAA